MTKGELITILELYKRGRWNLEGVLTAIDRYSSALISAKPIVSRSFSGRDETDAEIIEQAKKIWQNKDIANRKLQAVKYLMSNGWGLKVAHEYGISNFG